MPTVDFYFDVVCPYAYLAFNQMPGIAERTGASVNYKPILLGGVFKSIDAPQVPMNSMPQNKQQMNLWDMHRWAEHFETPLQFPPEHPRRTVEAMRAIHASPDPIAATKALYTAYWSEGLDVADRTILQRVLDKANLDGETILSQIDSPAIKASLRATTDEAVAAGVFGVPAFVIENELIWGQDRLHFVEKLLKGWQPT